MDQYYKSFILRVYAWIYLGAAIVTLIFVVPNDYTALSLYRVVEYSILALGILLLQIWKSKVNYLAWTVSIYQWLSSFIVMELQYHERGEVIYIAVFTLPILWMFLVGRVYGLYLCLSFSIAGLLLISRFEGGVQTLGTHPYSTIYAWFVLAFLSYIIEFVRERHAETIHQIAETDSLTKLYNRTGFLIQLQGYILAGKTAYLVQLDIDDFRRINLALGSDKSDRILKRIAKVLKDQPKVMAPCRHYGDGFAWISEQDSNELSATVAVIMDRIGEAKNNSENIPLTATFAAARFPEDAGESKLLWSYAESALKYAKVTSKSSLRFYQPEDSKADIEQLRLVEELRSAIENDEIDVHFQPKVCMASNRVCGFEALVRWTNKEGKYIPPPQFIGLAEKQGLIHDLGLNVLFKAIQLIHYLKDNGVEDINVSVNVSASQFAHPQMVDDFLAMCKEYVVDPEKIGLEVTESLLLDKSFLEKINMVRALGFPLSLDDFGTGFSSLSYLSDFPFDELKVDKSFTDVFLRSPKDRHVFESIINLSKGLGLINIIEGVETKEQVEAIKGLGDVQIQGWYFSKALPQKACLDFVKNFDLKNFN